MKAKEGAAKVESWLGIETVAVSNGQASLRMPTRTEMANGAEVVHGGLIALLADCAMGRAMATVLRAGERCDSFDLKMNFIGPGRIGEPLTAVARVLHSGRRTGVAECRVESEDGRLVATATASFIVYLPEN
jgi:acyl-CoA thioesterase